MAPQIQFVSGRRSRVACAIDGTGPPLVLPAWWVSHVRRDFAGQAFCRFFTQLASCFTVVRYDRPGVGLSDRERATFTLEDEVATLQAVIDELAFPRVSLLAVSCGAPPAMALAARHPERMERLMVFGGYASGPDIAPPDVRAALPALVRASWGIVRPWQATSTTRSPPGPTASTPAQRSSGAHRRSDPPPEPFWRRRDGIWRLQE